MADNKFINGILDQMLYVADIKKFLEKQLKQKIVWEEFEIIFNCSMNLSEYHKHYIFNTHLQRKKP